MIAIITVVLFLYGLAIFALVFGLSKVKNYKMAGVLPKTKFSIVVPFRNEAENLPVLLASISKLNYPSDRFEVVLIDDDSEKIFQIPKCEFQITVIKSIRISNAPKKDAITTAMQVVNNEWVITTDADCVVHENWLRTLDDYIQNHQVSMIAAAVQYDEGKSFLYHFQQLDFASLQGATMGSFAIGKGFMCNGANFAYKKAFFQELKGFNGNDKLASGDDVFLLQKAIVQFPEKVHYLKSESSIVVTKALNSWKEVFYQRVRWASKAGAYKNTFGIGLGLIVFGGNLSVLFAFYCLLFEKGCNDLLVTGLVMKFFVDFLLIKKTNAFFKINTKFYFLSSVLYPFFSVSVALYSLVWKYQWKGRTF